MQMVSPIDWWYVRAGGGGGGGGSVLATCKGTYTGGGDQHGRRFRKCWYRFRRFLCWKWRQRSGWFLTRWSECHRKINIWPKLLPKKTLSPADRDGRKRSLPTRNDDNGPGKKTPVLSYLVRSLADIRRPRYRANRHPDPSGERVRDRPKIRHFSTPTKATTAAAAAEASRQGSVQAVAGYIDRAVSTIHQQRLRLRLPGGRQQARHMPGLTVTRERWV